MEEVKGLIKRVFELGVSRKLHQQELKAMENLKNKEEQHLATVS